MLVERDIVRQSPVEISGERAWAWRVRAWAWRKFGREGRSCYRHDGQDQGRLHRVDYCRSLMANGAVAFADGK